MSETYFEPDVMRSFKTSGFLASSTYYFRKGEPTVVKSVEDASKFRGLKELIEVDKDGNRLSQSNDQSLASRSYRSYRERNDYNQDNERLLATTFDREREELEGQIEKQQVKPAERLKALEEVEETQFKKVERKSEDVQEAVHEEHAAVKHKAKKSAPKAKKGQLDCPQCGRQFDNDQKLAVHLEDHEDED